ncbi:unnamed protein product, partial [Brassica oleracea]
QSISKILDYALSAQLSGGSAGEALSMVLTSTVRCLLLILTPKMKFLSSLYQLMSVRAGFTCSWCYFSFRILLVLGTDIVRYDYKDEAYSCFLWLFCYIWLA